MGSPIIPISKPSKGRSTINALRGLYTVSPIRRLIFGNPIPTEHQDHARLRKLLALPVFSSDAISSVAYATQQILLMLGAAGLWVASESGTYKRLALEITGAIVVLLIIVVTSYWQTIFAYPSGGGSYIVSKDNLGVSFGLIAASALLIDYVLTVAVSIASGVQNLLATPIFMPFSNKLTLICVLCILVITYLNLRGLRESGQLFAFPTYTFILMGMTLIVFGVLGVNFHMWHIYTNQVNQVVPEGAYTHAKGLAGLAFLAVALRAFASGCSAMTGTEAVSNGIPAFRKPESKNAALTLLAMAVVLGSLLIGTSWLGSCLHIVYWEHGKATAEPVMGQLSAAIFGKPGPGLHIHPFRVFMYYMMQFSTMLILVVAAQTSFADFPRLSAILARDRFLPRQLTNQGDKLVFSNGIVLLGIFSIILIVAFHGSVDRLIPLYAIGVFTAFTLSQSGMVAHWQRTREPGWWWKMPVNGFGALATFIVLVTILYEKVPEGAYIVIIASAVIIVGFVAISRHYEYLRSRLSITNFTPKKRTLTNTVLLLVPSLHRGIFPALEYAKSLSPDCRAIHVDTDPVDTTRLLREWEQHVGEEPPLVILPSPYRSLVGPMMAYLQQVQNERENHLVTVIVPQFVPGKWWYSILHNANGILVKYYLAQQPGVIVSNVRYFLAGEDGDIPTAAVDPVSVTTDFLDKSDQ